MAVVVVLWWCCGEGGGGGGEGKLYLEQFEPLVFPF